MDVFEVYASKYTNEFRKSKNFYRFSILILHSGLYSGRRGVAAAGYGTSGSGAADGRMSAAVAAGSEETMLSTMNFVKPRQGSAPKYSL